MEYQNFKLIETIPNALRQRFIGEIKPADWTLYTGRQKAVQCQRETQTISLREFHVPEGYEGRTVDLHTTVDDQIARYPNLANWLRTFAARNGTSLARAMIVRLKPWGEVYRHHDFGDYYAVRDRFHLVLKSPAGSAMTSGDEAAIMRPGEVWWFNNLLMHQSFNYCKNWRWHVIFDINRDAYKRASSPNVYE